MYTFPKEGAVSNKMWLWFQSLCVSFCCCDDHWQQQGNGERERDPRLTLMSKRDMGDRAYDDITGRHTNNWWLVSKMGSCTCNCKDTWHARGIQKICADHRQMEVSCIASWHLSESQELWFPNEAYWAATPVLVIV